MVVVVHQWTNHMVHSFTYDSMCKTTSQKQLPYTNNMETSGNSKFYMVLTWSWHFEECWQGLVEHWTRVSHERPVKCGGHSQLLPIHVPPFLHGTATHQSSSEARSQCAPSKHHAQRLNYLVMHRHVTQPAQHTDKQVSTPALYLGRLRFNSWPCVQLCDSDFPQPLIKYWHNYWNVLKYSYNQYELQYALIFKNSTLHAQMYVCGLFNHAFSNQTAWCQCNKKNKGTYINTKEEC
jgi:hypothetical protein